jgi:hypothetical protein
MLPALGLGHICYLFSHSTKPKTLQGFVGVASAGSGYYVIALADPNVQQGALAGRLRSLGSHVREAFSQLD